MRILREIFHFSIAFLLALAGYAVPLAVLLLSALVPDPERLIIEKAPEREVGLAPDEGLLDDAFLRDTPGPAPQDPEPGEAKEAPDEPVVVAPVEPKPKPKPVEEKEAEKEPVEEKAEAPPTEALPERADAPPKATPNGAAAAARAARAERLAAERAAVKKKGGGKGSKKQKCMDPTPGVASVGTNEWTVPRDVILMYASDLDAAAKLASVAWAHNDKGKVIGFTVKRIRCGSLLEQAGLQNGDIIHSVNGKEVRSVVNAFAAWRKVRKKDVVRVKITRKGQKMELKYQIE